MKSNKININELKEMIVRIVLEEKTKKQKQKKFDKVMGEFGDGTLKTSAGKKVTDRKQAIAIAYSESELNEDIYNDSETIDDSLIEYEVPEWALSPLINGDISALTDEEELKLNDFIDNVVSAYGNANFIYNYSDNDFLGFRRSNDIENLGGDVYRVYIRPSNGVNESKEKSTITESYEEYAESIMKSESKMSELFELSFRYCTTFGGKELLNNKGINSPLTFKTALLNGKITPDELDTVVKSPSTNLSFSETDLNKYVLIPYINNHKEKINITESYTNRDPETLSDADMKIAFSWLLVNGAKELLSSKGISDGKQLLDSLINGDITFDELDKATDTSHMTDYDLSFCETNLCKQIIKPYVEKRINGLHESLKKKIQNMVMKTLKEEALDNNVENELYDLIKQYKEVKSKINYINRTVDILGVDDNNDSLIELKNLQSMITAIKRKIDNINISFNSNIDKDKREELMKLQNMYGTHKPKHTGVGDKESPNYMM